MHRNQFLKTCGWGCLSALGGFVLLQSCAGTRYLTGTLTGAFLEIPLQSFEMDKGGGTAFRKYVVVQHSTLLYPICVFRLSATEYLALLMKCTHQGTELEVYGDRLQCPAHGSEFTQTGTVQNGPAETDLRRFPVQIENEILKINLT